MEVPMVIQPSRRDVFRIGGLAAGGAVLAGATGTVALAAAAPPGAWDQVPTILARIVPPTFPAKDFPITSYGAKPGSSDSTAAFAKAVAACSAAGGGRVTVPAGTWTTGAIELLDNVELNLASGATIKFSADTKKYPLVLTRWQGIECHNFSP